MVAVAHVTVGTSEFEGQDLVGTGVTYKSCKD